MSTNYANDEQLPSDFLNSVARDIVQLHSIVKSLNLESPSAHDMKLIRKTSVEISLVQKHLKEIFLKLDDLLRSDASILSLLIKNQDKLLPDRYEYRRQFFKGMDALKSDLGNCSVRELKKRIKLAEEFFSACIFKFIDERSEEIFHNTIYEIAKAIEAAELRERKIIEKEFQKFEDNGIYQTKTIKDIIGDSSIRSELQIDFELKMSELITNLKGITVYELEIRKKNAEMIYNSSQYRVLNEKAELFFRRILKIIDEQIDILLDIERNPKNNTPKKVDLPIVIEADEDEVFNLDTSNRSSKLGYTFCPYCNQKVYDYTKCPCIEKSEGRPGTRKYISGDPNPWRENAVRHMEDME
jgi:hypothetical protein